MKKWKEHIKGLMWAICPLENIQNTIILSFSDFEFNPNGVILLFESFL